MNVAAYLRDLAEDRLMHALPILSFPAVHHMGVTVHQLTSSSKLQAEAMALIADKIPSVASVNLMDLSVEAEAFGAEVRFSDDEVPTVIGCLVSNAEEAEALNIPSIGSGRTGLYVEAVRLAKQRIQDRPVLAGCIGPYSLAGRLMDVTEIMYLCYDEPELVHTVLKKAADFLISYCKAFRDAGADGIIIAEPLAGLLSPELAREFSCSYMREIIQAVQTDAFAVIYHNCGSAVTSFLPEIFALNAAAYHFGNAVDLREILAKAPANILCMGNISPAEHFAGGTSEGMYNAVATLLKDIGSAPNFLLSSGCDIPPHAKWENINAFFDAINDYNNQM